MSTAFHLGAGRILTVVADDPRAHVQQQQDATVGGIVEAGATATYGPYPLDRDFIITGPATLSDAEADLGEMVGTDTLADNIGELGYGLENGYPNIQTPDTTDGTTGSITIKSGDTDADGNSGNLTLATGYAGGGDAGGIAIAAGDSDFAGGDGGFVAISGGYGSGTNGAGGQCTMSGGEANGDANGGTVTLLAGQTFGVGNGGNVQATGGACSGTGNGGNASLTSGAGKGAGKKGGNITLTIGLGSSGAAQGNLVVVHLPTADPGVAGALYSNGVPSAGVPKALMISGG